MPQAYFDVEKMSFFDNPVPEHFLLPFSILLQESENFLQSDLDGLKKE